VDIDGGVWVTTDIPVVDKERTKDEMNPVYTDKVLFSKAERKHLVLAYALSIHKAQGSQYRRVIMVCLNRDSYALLDRSLVYTGVTRTKQSCVIVGELAAFWRGIETVKHRRTVLQELGGV
jgi:exodeoxyribonuclease V alpha subunit